MSFGFTGSNPFATTPAAQAGSNSAAAPTPFAASAPVFGVQPSFAPVSFPSASIPFGSSGASSSSSSSAPFAFGSSAAAGVGSASSVSAAAPSGLSGASSSSSSSAPFAFCTAAAPVLDFASSASTAAASSSSSAPATANSSSDFQIAVSNVLSAGFSSFVFSAPSLAPASLLWVPQPENFRDRLCPQLESREGVFAINWHESAMANGPTMLLRYIEVGEARWRAASFGRIGHEAALGWLVEKLEADLDEGRECNHEARMDGWSAIARLISYWFNDSLHALPLLRVLLSAPSLVSCVSDLACSDAAHEILESMSCHDPRVPFRVAACIEGFTMLLKQGAVVQPILALFLEQSNIRALLQLIQTAPKERLRAASLEAFRTHVQMRERNQPYVTPIRLCRELLDRVCEWQAAALADGSPSCSSSSDDEPASSLSPALDSSTSFAVWLSSFQTALPRRLLASECLSQINQEAEGGACLAALAQFDWLDLAEGDGLMKEMIMFDGTLPALTLERVRQLTARERARAADDPLIPASGPLSPLAVLIHLICQAIQLLDGIESADVLRELLSAATAPVFAASSPSSPFCAEVFGVINCLSTSSLIRAALICHEAGSSEYWDGTSFSLRLIRHGRWEALQRWFAPDNAHISMPLGWLGERVQTLSSSDEADAAFDEDDPESSALLPIPPHPHLAADCRCDVWDEIGRRIRLPSTRAMQLFMQHAVDWHYATVTPRLREALSPHLIPDLHAEVQSWLMPPTTLKDPAPAVELSQSPPFVLLESVIRNLRADDVENVSALRRVQHHLREAAVARGFAERAFESERQMMLLAREEV